MGEQRRRSGRTEKEKREDREGEVGGQRRRSGRTEKEKWENREGEVGGQRRRRGRTEKEKWKEKDAKWNKVEELRQKGYAVNSGDFLILWLSKLIVEPLTCGSTQFL